MIHAAILTYNDLSQTMHLIGPISVWVWGLLLVFFFPQIKSQKVKLELSILFWTIPFQYNIFAFVLLESVSLLILSLYI